MDERRVWLAAFALSSLIHAAILGLVSWSAPGDHPFSRLDHWLMALTGAVPAGTIAHVWIVTEEAPLALDSPDDASPADVSPVSLDTSPFVETTLPSTPSPAPAAPLTVPQPPRLAAVQPRPEPPASPAQAPAAPGASVARPAAPDPPPTLRPLTRETPVDRPASDPPQAQDTPPQPTQPSAPPAPILPAPIEPEPPQPVAVEPEPVPAPAIEAPAAPAPAPPPADALVPPVALAEPRPSAPPAERSQDAPAPEPAAVAPVAIPEPQVQAPAPETPAPQLSEEQVEAAPASTPESQSGEDRTRSATPVDQTPLPESAVPVPESPSVEATGTEDPNAGAKDHGDHEDPVVAPTGGPVEPAAPVSPPPGREVADDAPGTSTPIATEDAETPPEPASAAASAGPGESPGARETHPGAGDSSLALRDDASKGTRDQETALTELAPAEPGADAAESTASESTPAPLPLAVQGASPVIRSLTLPAASSGIGGLAGSGQRLDLSAALETPPEAQETEPPLPTPVVTGPEVLVTVVPEYPRRARQLGIEGAVTLEVDIDPDGVPRAARVTRSSGRADMDEAAKNAVLQWRFVPGPADDESSERRAVVVIQFQLSG